VERFSQWNGACRVLYYFRLCLLYLWASEINVTILLEIWSLWSVQLLEIWSLWSVKLFSEKHELFFYDIGIQVCMRYGMVWWVSGRFVSPGPLEVVSGRLLFQTYSIGDRESTDYQLSRKIECFDTYLMEKRTSCNGMFLFVHNLSSGAHTACGFTSPISSSILPFWPASQVSSRRSTYVNITSSWTSPLEDSTDIRRVEGELMWKRLET